MLSLSAAEPLSTPGYAFINLFTHTCFTLVLNSLRGADTTEPTGRETAVETTFSSLPLTSRLDGCGDEGLGFPDPLHGLLDLLVGGVGLHGLVQVHPRRHMVQPTVAGVMSLVPSKGYMWGTAARKGPQGESF